jgi:hypothetical protein
MRGSGKAASQQLDGSKIEPRLTAGEPLLLSITTEAAAPTPSYASRSLYAVNEFPDDRGSISVYDIDAGRLIK